MFPCQIQGNRITIVVNNRPYTLSAGQLGYDELREAIRNKEWDKVPHLVSPKKVIVSYTNGSNITILDDATLCYKGVALGEGITKRILKMRQEGFDITPMTNLLENLMTNESEASRNEFIEFADSNDLPITPDGHFLAYKKVRNNYMDCHSGTISNRVGEKPSMNRTLVDADRRNECSVGLHFCSYTYLSNFGGSRIMILKINPADVVSIPLDYNRAKGRCWKYEVVGEVAVDAAQVDDCLSAGPVVNDSATDSLDGMTGRQLYAVARKLDPGSVNFGELKDQRFRDIPKAIEKIRKLYSTSAIIKAST